MRGDHSDGEADVGDEVGDEGEHGPHERARDAHDLQGDAVEDGDDESEPGRDAHVVAGARAKLSTAATGLGKRLPSAARLRRVELVSKVMKSKTATKKNRSVNTSSVPESREATKSITCPGSTVSSTASICSCLTPRMRKSAAPVHDRVLRLLGVLGKQVCQPGHGDDQREREQEEHQVGGKKHQDRGSQLRKPVALDHQRIGCR